jgi:arginyl-tRNA synthetase
MQTEETLIAAINEALKSLYDTTDDVTLQPTRKEFAGSFTYVVFPLVKSLRKNPVEIGEAIGAYLVENVAAVSGFNVVKGFVNIELNDSVWVDTFNAFLENKPETVAEKKQSVMVEFSSPNTNKPLHLGHLRNIFLGDAVARILKANGNQAVKTCLVNDRGVHICKSMIAYQRFGNGETPESSGIKGDHLAGKYYVAFDKAYKAEIAELMAGGMTEELAKKEAPLMKATQEMLVKWEESDAEVMELWKKMNTWVFAGFNETYTKIGVEFDKIYYESDTYLLGKDLIDGGLEDGVFYKKEDNSVWIDLTEEGLDEKLVLRGDGTSVYITQDLGTTDKKFEDFKNDKSVWVVGNEQDYHFKVLFNIMKKLGRSYADGCYHLSYGMVDLPSGKMKSREGTVVDADDLVATMIATAEETTRERGKIDDFSEEEANNLFEMLGLGALKYFLLKVEPKKRMLFDPKESIDFQGNTGPFIQYTHARIRSILRKAVEQNLNVPEKVTVDAFAPIEVELVTLLTNYQDTLSRAAEEYAPSLVANYCYDLAKTFNSFYGELTVMNEEDQSVKLMRLALIKAVADTLKKGMKLLGVEVPERM